MSIRDDIYAACFVDPVLFAFTFLKEWYGGEDLEDPRQISWFQRGILAIQTRKANFLLDYPDQDKIAGNFFYWDHKEKCEKPVFTFHPDSVEIVVTKFDCLMIPRGFSKTTLTNTALAHDIAYKSRKYIVLVSTAQNHAEDQVETIVNEFETNAHLIEVFGKLVPPPRHKNPNKSEHIRFLNGVDLKAKGRGAQIRGQLVMGKRPDKIILDDVESTESVATPEQRVKTRKWAFNDVKFALPRVSSNATLIVLGTMLHAEGLIPTAMKSKEFHGIKFGAIDRQGEALCPQFMTLEQLEASKEAATAVGELSGWYMENMSEIRSDDAAIFPSRCIIVAPPEGNFVGYSIALDPAISETVEADYASLATLGIRQDGLIWILDFYAEKGVTAEEQLEEMFRMYKALPPISRRIVGIEAIAFQRSLIHTARAWMFRKKCYFEIQPITHGRVGKHERIKGVLQPRYKAGYMRHAQSWPLLEQQLQDFPRGKDDGPDAVSMALTLLDPYAATAAGDDIDLAANEYQPLRGEGRAP